MYARSIVAVLDFNANVDRPDKVVDGKTVYKLKVQKYVGLICCYLFWIISSIAYIIHKLKLGPSPDKNQATNQTNKFTSVNWN